MFRRLAIALALLAAPLFLTGAGKKAQSYLISFHAEASEEEAPKFASPVKMGSEMRQYFFKKAPEFTDKDIAWFYPFISEDGQTFGAAFKLKDSAAQGLKALCLTHSGKLLGARIPNAPYTAVMIDRPVDDGIIVVWQGLSKAHLKEFEKKFPHAEPTGPSATPDPTAVALPN